MNFSNSLGLYINTPIMHADYDYDQFPIDKDELYMEVISSNSLMFYYFIFYFS
jgi:hypothetical protein